MAFNPKLGSINDVTLTSISSDEVLKWNGTAWINQTLAEAGIADTANYATTAALDAAIEGLDPKEICEAATTADLTSGATYAWSAGTFTEASPTTGALTVDTVVLATGDRVLVKDQGTKTQNGIYVVAGIDGSSAVTLVRADDASTAAELANAYVFIAETAGAANTLTGWLQKTITSTGTVNSSNVEFTQFTSAAASSTFAALTDTTISGLANGDLLKYNISSEKWTNATAASLGIVDWTGSGAGTIHASNYTNTTYSVGDGGLTENDFTDALKTKLNAIEASADVTDATNVAAAGAVMEADYDANTILAATSDNTPAALTVAASRIVGRTSSGNIAGLTAAEVLTLIGVEASADVTDSTNVAAAGALMDSEVTSLDVVKALAIGIGDGNFLTANDVVADNDWLRIDGTEVEGRSDAEVISDLGLLTTTAASSSYLSISSSGLPSSGHGNHKIVRGANSSTAAWEHELADVDTVTADVGSSSNTTALANAKQVYLGNGSSGDITLFLGDAGGTDVGVVIYCKNIHATNSFTISRGGSSTQTIDGAASYTLSDQYEAVKLVCTAAGAWSIF